MNQVHYNKFPILFRTSERKALESLIWLANRWGGKLDPMYAHIFFFLVEKEHLLDYGRPIFGDTYVAMTYYPFGLMIRDLIERKYISYEISRDAEKSIKTNLSADGFFTIDNSREPDLDCFSKSDIDAFDNIEKILKENCSDANGFIDNKKLINFMSIEDTFRRSKYREVIGYERFIPEDHENREAFIDQIEESTLYGVFSH